MKTTAGLLMYLTNPFRVFLVKPAGPDFETHSKNFWSIPKGHSNPGEDLLDTAKREFYEEVGFNPTIYQYYDLGRVVLKPKKELWVWAFNSNTPIDWVLKSNTFQHKDGNTYPEIDKAEFFTLDQVNEVLELQQIEFVRRLQKIVCTRTDKIPQAKKFNEMFKKKSN